uniref:Histidine kinase n=1 Tax=Tetraselmis sp. GSL018 TaxID=582737 RepID=A0A061RXT5_9CHLO
MMIRLLKGECVDMTTAENGAEAIELVKRRAFDVILMDCNMPVMDGWQATRAIRAWERDRGLRSTPIVAVTANALEGDRERCLDCGMDAYLAKPVDKAAILAALRQQVQWWPAAAAAGNRPQGTGPVGVLLADESIDSLMHTKWLLESEGMRVGVAENGFEAVRGFRADPGTYRVVMLSTALSLKSAAATAQEIHSSPSCGGEGASPIVILLKGGMGARPEPSGDSTDDEDGFPVPVTATLDLPMQTATLRRLLQQCGLRTRRSFELPQQSAPRPHLSWRQMFAGARVLLLSRVLLTGGDEMLQGVLQRMLSLDDAVVLACPQGGEAEGAAAAAGRRQVDLVVADLTSCSRDAAALLRQRHGAPLLSLVGIGDGPPQLLCWEGEAELRGRLQRPLLAEAMFRLLARSRSTHDRTVSLQRFPPAPPMPVQTALDAFDGDWEFVLSLLVVFTECGQQWMAELAGAACNLDAGAVRFLASALGNSAHSAFLNGLADAYAVMKDAVEGPPEALRRLLPPLGSLAQAMFLDAMRFIHRARHPAVLNIPAGLKWAGGDFGTLVESLHAVVRKGMVAVAAVQHSGDTEELAAALRVPHIASVAPTLHLAVTACSMIPGSSASNVSHELNRLQGDLLCLAGRSSHWQAIRMGR